MAAAGSPAGCSEQHESAHRGLSERALAEQSGVSAGSLADIEQAGLDASLRKAIRQRFGKLSVTVSKEMEPQNTQNTQMDGDEASVNRLSNRIIGCALAVLHTLGAGFLEKVYENALAHELRQSGLVVSQQHGMIVRYDGIVVGEYTVDLLVEQMVLVELKAVRALDDVHRAQCLNYLKATGLRLCLLLNFGRPRLEIKRIVLAL